LLIGHSATFEGVAGCNEAKLGAAEMDGSGAKIQVQLPAE